MDKNYFCITVWILKKSFYLWINQTTENMKKLSHYYGRWADINNVINAKIQSPHVATGQYLGLWLVRELQDIDARGQILKQISNYNLNTSWKL